MDNRILDITKREATGKEAARKLRREGYIPAIMYGFKGNKNVAVKFTEFKRLFEEIGDSSISPEVKSQLFERTKQEVFEELDTIIATWAVGYLEKIQEMVYNDVERIIIQKFSRKVKKTND